VTLPTDPAGSAPQTRSRLSRAVADANAVAGRNLLTIVRLPQLLVFSTVQPVIFVLLFRYAFGGAIQGNLNVDYVDYLMPGIFAQTVAFGAMSTGIGLADDLQKGLIERFRSLPMARSAVLTGRILADLVRNVFVVILMCIVGFAVGFRIHTNVFEFIAGLLVLLFFGCALSAMFALIGLSVPNAESAQAAGFPLLAPLVFASSAFVPVDTMPGWLQAFAEYQPVSVVIDAVRACALGTGPGTDGLPRGPDALPLVLGAVAWTIGILAVFGPLAVRRYRRAA